MEFKEKNNERQGNVAFKAHYKCKWKRTDREDLFISLESEDRKKKRVFRRKGQWTGCKVPINPMK